MLFFLPQLLYASVDIIDWSVLEEKWRKPLCLEESVYPLNYERAKQLSESKEEELKKIYSVSQIEGLAFGKNAPTPDILDSLRDIIVFKSLEVARSNVSNTQKVSVVKKYAKSAYSICSRILNKYPDTRCHDFLLINIKPNEFMTLISQHFEVYKASAIYLMDMQNQCRDLQNPDWNCSALAKDYFAKNHLESCIARQLEPPEKIEPITSLIDPVINK
ncbi:MAG: hypothetical protein H6625_02910 [Bdellovibrionaceae bacterium]|nr:hypothetical protein [Pseudobdellovibrionaceae bacterium]